MGHPARIVVMTFVILFWWSQNKKTKKDILQSRENLSKLTRILLEKNSMIISLEKKITELQSNIQVEKTPLLRHFENGSANMDVLIPRHNLLIVCHMEQVIWK